MGTVLPRICVIIVKSTTYYNMQRARYHCPMPTYGYECLSCDNQFETIQSIKDDALTTCETCGGKLRKRIYPVGISFKGSGFYSTDYGNKKGPKTEPKEAAASSSDSSNGSSDSGSSDSGSSGSSESSGSSDSKSAEKKPEKSSTGAANKGD